MGDVNFAKYEGGEMGEKSKNKSVDQGIPINEFINNNYIIDNIVELIDDSENTNNEKQYTLDEIKNFIDKYYRQLHDIDVKITSLRKREQSDEIIKMIKSLNRQRALYFEDYNFWRSRYSIHKLNPNH
jgi:hypothetical protein